MVIHLHQKPRTVWHLEAFRKRFKARYPYRYQGSILLSIIVMVVWSFESVPGKCPVLVLATYSLIQTMRD